MTTKVNAPYLYSDLHTIKYLLKFVYLHNKIIFPIFLMLTAFSSFLCVYSLSIFLLKVI